MLITATTTPVNRREGEVKAPTIAIINNRIINDIIMNSATITGTTMEEIGTTTIGTKTTKTEGMETTEAVYNATATETETLNLSKFKVPTTKDRTFALTSSAQVDKLSFRTTSPRGTPLTIGQAKVATAKTKSINWIPNQMNNRKSY